MKQLPLLFITFFLCTGFLTTQEKEGITTTGRETAQSPFPVKYYKELPNPIAPNSEEWENYSGIKVSWGSTDIRYKKEAPIPIKKEQSQINLQGWKGERVAAQWVASSFDKTVTLSYEISDFTLDNNPDKKISKDQILAGFIRYVMTDELNKDGKGACGVRTDHSLYDSSLVADVIDQQTKELTLPAQSTRPGWIRIWIPQNAVAGKYKGYVTVKGDGQILQKLEVNLEVKKHTLPQPHDWTFHLDLWQNPYAVARYYQVKPWSKAHFDHLRKDMKHYVHAGGDVITTSIMHKPWDGQTYDYFETMITWMKKADGSWYFDYTIFDKWVEFMMDLGIDKQINCYSMIPWKLSFQYYDQATNSLQYIKAKPGDSVYHNLWVTMLTSFAKHLKEKGWFDITYIAMDERPLEDMEAALKVIYEADNNYKVALAGNLHKELVDKVDDYCLSFGQHFSPKVLQEREQANMISTYYTSCAHPYPNTFTFSPPAESEWLAWSSAAQHLDGFLRWAYNSWVIEPLLDSRFKTWAAGDTYFVYPGGRTSIRFERLVAGIQQYEKIHILKKALIQQGKKQDINKLNKILKGFKELNPKEKTASESIHDAKKKLSRLYKKI